MRPKQPLPPWALSEEVQKIGETLVEGSDLAVALIAASFLDECLCSLLMASFRSGDTSESLLRSGRGALGTYSARTDLAYSLGLIDKHALKALRAVGEIRNVFAHSYVEATFERADIAALCSTLEYPYELHVNQWSAQEERHKIRDQLDRFFQRHRNQFTYTCVLLGQTLIFAAKDAQAKGGLKTRCTGRRLASRGAAAERGP